MKKYYALVVDDQPNWRGLWVELLESQFEVKSAANYEDALGIIRDQNPPFHVVVTDMRLVDDQVGNEDGLRLIDYLNKRGDETKTIVVTGYANITTARKALSNLAAYDYLEKRPSDGPFDITEFQRIIEQAAQEAEENRPQGFADISQNILVFEPESTRSTQLANILQKDGYQATILRSKEDLEAYARKGVIDCALILVSETLSTNKLFERLHQLYPSGKIIILTQNDVGGIMNAMREYPVLTAFHTPNNQLDTHEFRELIHSALSSAATKYVSMQISHPDRPAKMITSGILGQTYQVDLSIQNAPTQGAVGIFLPPQRQKRGKLRLQLFIYAEHMKLEPGSEAYWQIPLEVERPESFKFSITPNEPGKKNITIDIEQDRRWLGRVSMPFQVQQKLDRTK